MVNPSSRQTHLINVYLYRHLVNASIMTAGLAFLLWACLVIPVSGQGNTCTNLDNVHHLERSVQVAGSTFLVLQAEGIMTCAAHCLNRKRCRSINFSIQSGLCQLNEDAATSQLVNNSSFVFSDISRWPQRLVGVCANHDCSQFDVCRSRANWTAQAPCSLDDKVRRPTSCADVKLCTGSEEDGEYWIFLEQFDGAPRRLFCHGMNETTPKTFLTLSTPNVGVEPNIRNHKCKGEYVHGQRKETTYRKIRLNETTLAVDIEDATFAEVVGQPLRYGQAQDCYSEHDNGVLSACGLKGYFFIDLSHTGFVVSEKQKWKTYGWLPLALVNRTEGGAVVNVQCGGFCGGCTPDGNQLLLDLNRSEDLPQLNATLVRCL
ncbi:A disintegrin and metalloproteinase with thrombospondin motifs 9-like [Haliotis rubra]|uniref:A disintegrin and metalloproteinase with thrombospondin motifs 9-like n=1 Tax=Haliotis rubra TaxID=36100 RepID=UPI001EE6191E|nr:A disintegrin and metalloproteinase with thrombospondin motifs 9-like [Haliotis rubra]